MKVFFVSLYLVFTVFCSISSSQQPMKIVGYWPSWSPDCSNLNFQKLTHLIYAFALPGSDGRIKPIPETALLTQLVSNAHAHHVKVSLSFGGWSNQDDGFKDIVAKASLRRNFIDHMLICIKNYSLDGIDIDWEYPDKSDEISGFTALVKELGPLLKSSGKILTVAVTQDDFPKSINKELIAYFDFLNIMAYDNSGSHHSTYNDALEAVSYWRDFGLKKEQIVIGVPFYSRGETQGDLLAYKDIISKYPDAYRKDTYEAEGLTYHYNGIPTIKKKAALALNQGGGIMIWELSQDAPGEKSLLSVIYDVLFPTSLLNQK